MSVLNAIFHLKFSLKPWLLASGVCLVTCLAAEIVLRNARRWPALTPRASRRRRDRKVPVLGGITIYLPIAGFVLLSVFGFQGVPAISAQSAAWLLTGLTFIFVTGLLNDLIGVSSRARFLAQVASGGCLVLASPSIPHPVFTAFLVLWTTVITSALKRVDELDGMCAGISGLSAVTVSLLMASVGLEGSFPFALAVVLAAASFGFLVFNFHPAKIKLGTSGAYVLGFVLALVSVEVEAKRSLFVSLGIPLFMLGIPVLDYMSRDKRFKGGMETIQSRMRQIGLSHRAAVALIWGASAFLDSVAFLLAQMPLADSIYVYALVIPTLAFAFMALYFMERRIHFQTEQFGHFFMKKERRAEHDRRVLLATMTARARSAGNFALIVLDLDEPLREIAAIRPRQLIEFYMNLYAAFRARLRSSDLLSRPSDSQIIFLPMGNLEDPDLRALVLDLSRKVKALQESYDLYLPAGEYPQGFRTFRFPQDVELISSALGLSAAEIHDLKGNPVAEQAAG